MPTLVLPCRPCWWLTRLPASTTCIAGAWTRWPTGDTSRSPSTPTAAAGSGSTTPESASGSLPLATTPIGPAPSPPARSRSCGATPETAAAGFLDAAHEAFTHGLVTAGISALVAAVAAILVLVVLRRVDVDTPAHTQAQGSSADTGTPHATDRPATTHSAAKLPCRCCGPELITTGVSGTGTQEPT
jgi:hypothetical protein